MGSSLLLGNWSIGPQLNSSLLRPLNASWQTPASQSKRGFVRMPMLREGGFCMKAEFGVVITTA
jgi:hypothetical protein